MYIFVGVLLGSLVTSVHMDYEACAGRKAVLIEKNVVGDCFPMPYTVVPKGPK
jgi:hypothetical protein